jgi:voltage-gated potassium channel Kch
MGLFFLAVWMTIDLAVVSERWAMVLAGVAGLVAVKFAILYGLARAFGAAGATALRVAGLICQGGEFAFVLLAQATATGLVSAGDGGLATVVVTGSMAVTPLVLRLIDRLSRSSQDKPSVPSAMPETHPRVIIAGFGRFGQIVARILTSQKIPFTALDRDPSQVDFVRRFGNEIYFGDATRLDLLQTAHAGEARVLVICIDDVEDSMKLAGLAHHEFPNLKIVARARNRFHAYRLLELGIEHVFRETFASSLESSYRVLRELGLTASGASRAVRTFRRHDEALMARAAPHHADMEKLVQIAEEGRQELQSLFTEDDRT